MPPTPNIGKNIDNIYWGDGTIRNPGLNISQLAQHWGITKDRAAAVKAQKLTSIPADWKHKYTLAVGGFRSGKTFEDIFKHLCKAIMYPGYEALIIRKHHAQLRDTYLKDFKEMIDRVTEGNPKLLMLDEEEIAGTWHIFLRGPSRTHAKFIFRIEPDGDFTKIRDSFKGYNLGGFTMEEASELQLATWRVCCSRMSWMGGPTHGGMLSNPGFRGQWLPQYAEKSEERLREGKKAPCLVIRSETYENRHNLPDDYISDLEQQYEDDPVGLAMALQGKDGIEEKGRPVFQNFFKEDKHVDPSIVFNPYLPLVRGWDFGKRDAACGFWQFTKEGHARKVSELVVKGMYIEQFTDSVIRHTKNHYEPRAGIIDFGDFAGTHEKDTGASIQRVREYTKGAIQITAKYFGNMDPGLDHMKKLLSTTINGKFRLTYHPRCTWTIEAMKWGFLYKVLADSREMKKPFDNEYMHMMDADRYAICNALPIEEERAAQWNTGPIKARGPAQRNHS